MSILRYCTLPLSLVAVSLLLLLSTNAFYLPGVAPTVFKDDQEVTSYVSSVISPESTLQFDFYTVPFCRPSEVTDLAESLGEALVGDKAQTSAYKFQVNRNVNCAVLCRKQYTHAEMSRLADFALLDYRANMRLDNLPLAEMAEVVQEDSDNAETEYFLGFPIALNSEDEEHSADEHAEHADKHPTYFLANHLHFKIKIHPVTKSVVKGRHADGSLIVGFQVVPMSVKHTYDGEWSEGKSNKDKDKQKDKSSNHPEITSCDANGVKFPHTQLNLPSVHESRDTDLSDDETTEVIWTYDVVWEESDVEWASRWDVFLNMKGDKIRWVSIFNSLGVLLLLTGIVAALMLRILRKDLAAYNAVATDEEVAEMQEETGWKLVYADVFRAPAYARAYAVLHGAGAQFFLLVSLTLAFASLGFLSPSNRGSLLTAIVVFFALSGRLP
jgi:transmembrane 9 superfamily protein 2/4